MRMNDQFLVLSAVLLFGWSIVTTAVATDYDLTEEGVYSEFSMDTSVYLYETSGFVAFEGEFNDSFTFIAPEGYLWSFGAFARGWDGMTEFTRISFQETLGDILGWSASIGGNTWLYFETFYPNSEIIIEPGEYTVFLSGIATVDSAEYGMDISLVSISPIPEPSSVVLMFVGLGLIGLMVLRRRQFI